MACNKCRQTPAREGDTWCLSCSAWETIGVALTSRWASAGLRGSAAEAVVGTARLLKSLRNVDAGLLARAKSEASRPRDLAVKEEEEEKKGKERSRSPLVRARSSAPSVVPPAKEEYSEGSESEEVGVEEPPADPQVPASEGRGGHLRPPEPAHPPRHHHRREHTEREDKDRDRDRRRDNRSHKKKDKKDKGGFRKKRSRRGGRKHKRLERLVENSDVAVHRTLPPEFWAQGLERRSHLSPTPRR